MSARNPENSTPFAPGGHPTPEPGGDAPAANPLPGPSFPPDTAPAPPGRFTPAPAPAATPRRRRNWTGPVSVVGAGLALVTAFVALLISWRALDQANDARDIASARDSAGQPSAPAPPSESPEVLPESSPVAPGDVAITPGEPELNEQTRYELAYEKEDLRLRGECSDTMRVDLDEPAAGINAGGDLTYNGACTGTPASLRLGEGAHGGESSAQTPGPGDCAKVIRTAPLPENGKVPVRQGVVLCVKTSFTAAREIGIPQRMVRVEVTGVGQDGAATIVATAWDIPN